MYERMDADQWMQSTFDAMVNGSISSQDMSRQDAINLRRSTYIDTYAKLNIYDAPKDKVFDENGRLCSTVLPGYRGEDMD